VREVAGSNPVVPTISINHLRLPALAAVRALWQPPIALHTHFSKATRLLDSSSHA